MRLKYFSLFLFLTTALLSKAQENECQIDIPQTISITSDSDRFSISQECEFEEFNFKLYSRWGELIFEAKNESELIQFDPSEKIEVKQKSETKYKITPGVYVFILEAKKPGEEKQTITRSINFL